MVIKVKHAETCHPIIPFRKRFTPKEVEYYLLKRCKPLLQVGPKFFNVRLRVNRYTGEGVRLDYIGCSIYDEIVRLNKILRETPRTRSLKEYDKLVCRFQRLKGVFSSCYLDAYQILVD